MNKPYRKLKHWLTQMYAYGVFFWKNDNYDWDYGYAIRLIRFKLKRMSDTIETNGIIESNKRVAKQIRYAVHLIDEYQSDRYLAELRKAHIAKWGKPTYRTIIASSNTVRRETDYPNAPTEELRLQAEAEFTEMIMEEHRYEEELIDRFFKHTRKYFQSWWD